MMVGFPHSAHPATALRQAGRLGLGLMLVAAALFIMSRPALAAGGWFDSLSSFFGGGGFRCSGGRAVGSLYDATVRCPETISYNNIFSFLICRMEQLSGDLLGNMYCGIMTAMQPAVIALLTMSILFFGTGFTIGVIPATARDFQLFLLKMAFIFTFTTQADALISIGYNALIGGLREGSAIGLSVMFPDGRITKGQDVYRYMDQFLGQAIRYATDYVGQQASTTNSCKNALFAVLAIMAVAFPPIFFIGVLISFRVAITFLRAAFGYLYSIVGISFLLTLSPFFLSFYMFKATRPFFDKWLGYLVSFGLQIVILFCFLGFILSINVKHITNNLVDIVVPVVEVTESSTMRTPWEYCTLCEFTIVDAQGKAVGTSANGTNLPRDGKLVCNKPIKPIRIFSAVSPGESTGSSGASTLGPIKNQLMQFAVSSLLALLILAYLVEYLLNYVGMLSSYLAGGMGASYAPQLGGGYAVNKASMDVPGGQLFETFERGVTDGYLRSGQDNKANYTSVDSSVSAVKKGFERLVLGGGTPGDRGAGVNDPGLVSTFVSFAINPHRDPTGH